MDTPSIEQIYDEVTAESAPLEVKSEEAISEPEKVEASTPPQQPEESFSSFNPNNLSPEMQEVYKKWQHDYTVKRQSEKAEIKELREKLSQVEQQGNQPQVNSQVETSYRQGVNNGQIDPRVSLQEYAQRIKDDVKSEIKVDQENSYIESQEKAFYDADPRFQEGPGQDKILFNHVLKELEDMRTAHEESHGTILGFDFVSNAKKLIESYDKRMEESVKTQIARQSELAKQNAQKSSKVNPTASGSRGKPTGKISVEEAFDAAIEEIGGVGF